MNELYHAYEAYERRVVRGEFDHLPVKALKNTAPPEPILTRAGDVLIQTGMRLKKINSIRSPLCQENSLESQP